MGQPSVQQSVPCPQRIGNCCASRRTLFVQAAAEVRPKRVYSALNVVSFVTSCAVLFALSYVRLFPCRFASARSAFAWPYDLMTASTAASAAAVAAAVAALTATFCIRAALDFAAPTIVRWVFRTKLFLAIDVLRERRKYPAAIACSGMYEDNDFRNAAKYFRSAIFRKHSARETFSTQHKGERCYGKERSQETR